MHPVAGNPAGMDSRGVFSPEALRRHLSMGLPFYGEKSTEKRAHELGTASRSGIRRRTKVESFHRRRLI
jgi:hypothetical protein